MLLKFSRIALWALTILILLLSAAQAWSGNWTVFYLLWPGYQSGNSFLLFVAGLANYHMKMGFAIGAFSVLIIILAFLSRSNLYVRIFSILGLLATAVAAYGGYLYVTSSLQDRLSLGQMADAFIGVFAAYFLLLFFMNGVPSFRRRSPANK